MEMGIPRYLSISKKKDALRVLKIWREIYLLPTIKKVTVKLNFQQIDWVLGTSFSFWFYFTDIS